MSKKVIISVDSTADLSPELCSRFDIRVRPVNILLGDESFPDTPDYSPEKIYRRYREDGTLPKTSSVSIQQYTDYFASFTAEGCEVVHLSIGSEISSSYNNARLAAAELEGVYVVDSGSISSGLGILGIYAAECRDRGMSAAQLAAELSETAGKVDISFVLDTLEFMHKGGRCSAIAALGANMLKIKPALEVRDGRMQIYKKYRGNRDAVLRTYVSERLKGRSIRPAHVFVTHSGEIDPALCEELAEQIRKTVPVDEILFGIAGCSVCSHCGPKTFGVIFINE